MILSALTDLFYPRECIITGNLPDHHSYRYLSKAGLEKLIRVDGPACKQCGFPFWGVILAPQQCPHCRETTPIYNEGKTLLLMNDAGRSLMHTLKYHNGRYLKHDIVKLSESTPQFVDFLKGAELVPVPLHSRKARERGFNQSTVIAEAFSECSGSPVRDILKRTVDTPSQTRLKRSDRSRNVRKAFSLKKSATINPQQRYILIDDVFTTGATLNACASALKAAGAQQIDVATLGHG